MTCELCVSVERYKDPKYTELIAHPWKAAMNASSSSSPSSPAPLGYSHRPEDEGFIYEIKRPYVQSDDISFNEFRPPALNKITRYPSPHRLTLTFRITPPLLPKQSPTGRQHLHPRSLRDTHNARLLQTHRCTGEDTIRRHWEGSSRHRILRQVAAVAPPHHLLYLPAPRHGLPPWPGARQSLRRPLPLWPIRGR